jgi:hypothetical protein
MFGVRFPVTFQVNVSSYIAFLETDSKRHHELQHAHKGSLEQAIYRDGLVE